MIRVIHSVKQLIPNQKGSQLTHQQQHFRFCWFHFRIFDDYIEMQSCEPHRLNNVSPSTDTKDTDQIYEEV